MLYLINVHWKRRAPQEGKPAAGHSTYAERGRYLSTAKAKAVRKFNRHFGQHLAVVRVAEVQDPAGIFR